MYIYKRSHSTPGRDISHLVHTSLIDSRFGVKVNDNTVDYKLQSFRCLF